MERVLLRWLETEKQRLPFTVIEHEHDINFTFAGFTLNGKIDRLDRLVDDSILLIDYKTGGRTTRSDWFPEPRMVDPQLPAYAVAMDPRPGAIAFARVRPDALEFDGLADSDTGTPGVIALAAATHKFKELVSWHELLDDWQTHLEALAGEFRAGKAAVDPRKPTVCRHCHLRALCRLQERAPFDTLAEENGDE